MPKWHRWTGGLRVCTAMGSLRACIRIGHRAGPRGEGVGAKRRSDETAGRVRRPICERREVRPHAAAKKERRSNQAVLDSWGGGDSSGGDRVLDILGHRLVGDHQRHHVRHDRRASRRRVRRGAGREALEVAFSWCPISQVVERCPRSPLQARHGFCIASQGFPRHIELAASEIIAAAGGDKSLLLP